MKNIFFLSVTDRKTKCKIFLWSRIIEIPFQWTALVNALFPGCETSVIHWESIMKSPFFPIKDRFRFYKSRNSDLLLSIILKVCSVDILLEGFLLECEGRQLSWMFCFIKNGIRLFPAFILEWNVFVQFNMFCELLELPPVIFSLFVLVVKLDISIFLCCFCYDLFHMTMRTKLWWPVPILAYNSSTNSLWDCSSRTEGLRL